MFKNDELISLSKYLLSIVPNINTKVVDYIKEYIIKHRERNISKHTHTKKILTTIEKLSDSTKENIKFTPTQMKNISFIYSYYLLRYFISQYNQLSKDNNNYTFEQELEMLYNNKQLLIDYSILSNNANTTFDIIFNKMKEICCNNNDNKSKNNENNNKLERDKCRNKLQNAENQNEIQNNQDKNELELDKDKNKLKINNKNFKILADEIYNSIKHYSIDKFHNIQYRLLDNDYQNEYTKNTKQKKHLLKNNAHEKQLFKTTVKNSPKEIVILLDGDKKK